jgi:hypothetical protein
MRRLPFLLPLLALAGCGGVNSQAEIFELTEEIGPIECPCFEEFGIAASSEAECLSRARSRLPRTMQRQCLEGLNDSFEGAAEYFDCVLVATDDFVSCLRGASATCDPELRSTCSAVRGNAVSLCDEPEGLEAARAACVIAD